jgi:hypothetical protein
MKRIDPNRIKDPDLMREAQECAKFLVDLRGTRGTASWLHWTMADVSRMANGKWNEIKLYPDQLKTLQLARDLAADDNGLVDPIRVAMKEFTEDIGTLSRKATMIRRMVRKVTR